MTANILSEHTFRGPVDGWDWPKPGTDWLQVSQNGSLVSPGSDESITLSGSGVHTRNGDAIELIFELQEDCQGTLCFGFAGGSEHALIELDLAQKRVRLQTSDWTASQPIRDIPLQINPEASHCLVIEKEEGAGRLIKNADITVYLDNKKVLVEQNLNILPEMGVTISIKNMAVLLRRFMHLGEPSGIPEYFYIGAWQMHNTASIEQNLASIKRGLRQAAEQQVQLMVTPETSLTGLFPRDAITQEPGPISRAEAELQHFMADLPGAPHLIIGLPVWRKASPHARDLTRFNESRLYAPDGHVVSSHAKIHSCEGEFWHGYELQEFDVCGVPIAMHICHDARYPEVWTLPVMFGARLILHPSNPAGMASQRETVDRFESRAMSSTSTSHAFYVHVTGAGGSFIAGPQKHNNLLASSRERARNNEHFPLSGPVVEDLVHARIRVHDAFGYWPVRSFRASEGIAEAYQTLYKAWGGKR